MTSEEQALFERYKEKVPKAGAVRLYCGRLTHILDTRKPPYTLCQTHIWTTDHQGDQSRPLCKACAKQARKALEKS